MRLNIYSQELTKETEIVSKVADTGIRYYGVRIYLASPDILHHTPEDDDRSAITFWIPNAKSFNKSDMVKLFHAMASLIEQCPDLISALDDFLSDNSELAVIPIRVASSVNLDGTLALSAIDLQTVLGALSDGADYRAARGDSGTLFRYRSLARALGDDR